MRKIFVEIDSCGHCPKRGWRDGYMYCFYPKYYWKEITTKCIPKWCPYLTPQKTKGAKANGKLS